MGDEEERKREGGREGGRGQLKEEFQEATGCDNPMCIMDTSYISIPGDTAYSKYRIVVMTPRARRQARMHSIKLC